MSTATDTVAAPMPTTPVAHAMAMAMVPMLYELSERLPLGARQ
jgi:hypothetical protein